MLFYLRGIKIFRSILFKNIYASFCRSTLPLLLSTQPSFLRQSIKYSLLLLFKLALPQEYHADRSTVPCLRLFRLFCFIHKPLPPSQARIVTRTLIFPHRLPAVPSVSLLPFNMEKGGRVGGCSTRGL